MRKSPPPTTRDQLVNRLKRLRGQVAGVERMINDDRYCGDVLMQVSAIRAAVDQLGIVLLTYHLQSCREGVGCQADPAHRLEEVKELMTSVYRLLGPPRGSPPDQLGSSKSDP